MKKSNRSAPRTFALRAWQRCLLSAIHHSHAARHQGPLYGLSLRSISKDRKALNLVFAWLAGQSYCCGEMGCAVPYRSHRWWRHLRKLASREGLRLPDSDLRIQALVITEPGAWFSVPAAFSEFSFEESTWLESEAPREL